MGQNTVFQLKYTHQMPPVLFSSRNKATLPWQRNVLTDLLDVSSPSESTLEENIP